MKTDFANLYAMLAAAAGLCGAIPLPAAADEPLEELDGPMAVFDDVTLVPAAMARMPLPAANAAGAAYNDAPAEAPAAADESADDDSFGEDHGKKRQIRAEFDRDLVEGVREGYRAPEAFEGLDRREERLGRREDRFHIEEGEDVDVEDGFNDEDEPTAE